MTNKMTPNNTQTEQIKELQKQAYWDKSKYDCDGVLIAELNEQIRLLKEDGRKLGAYLTATQPDGFTEYGLELIKSHRALMKQLEVKK